MKTFITISIASSLLFLTSCVQHSVCSTYSDNAPVTVEKTQTDL